MLAADLFFALDQETYVDGQPIFRSEPGFNALDVRERLAFVVGRTAGVDVAIASRGLEGRGLPKIERIGGLHVVVAVYQDGWRAGGTKPLGQYDRVARRFDLFDL